MTGLLWCWMALADVPPDFIDPCGSQEVGSVCHDQAGRRGVCQTESCQERRYDADAGWTAITVPCRVCVAPADAPVRRCDTGAAGSLVGLGLLTLIGFAAIRRKEA